MEREFHCCIVVGVVVSLRSALRACLLEYLVVSLLRDGVAVITVLCFEEGVGMCSLCDFLIVPPDDVAHLRRLISYGDC